MAAVKLSTELPLSYQRAFEEEKREVYQAVCDWHRSGADLSRLNLDRFESLVAIKNHQRVVTYDNAPLRDFVLMGQSTRGTNPDPHLSPHVAKASQLSDQMILEGVLAVEVEHLNIWRQGRTVVMTTYKRRLDALKNPAYSILLVSRIKGYADSIHIDRRLNLNDSLIVFQQLDDIDRRICRGYARGESTREIAATVGLTSRSIEMRRQKIMELLSVDKPIEIVKTMVRLEENGLLDERF